MNFEGLLKSWKENIEGIDIALFFNESTAEEWLCTNSSIEDYESSKTYSVYQVESLYRTIARKANFLSEEVLQKLYEGGSRDICLILVWKETDRRAAILRIEEMESISEAQLENYLEQLASDLLSYSKKELAFE